MTFTGFKYKSFIIFIIVVNTLNPAVDYISQEFLKHK